MLTIAELFEIRSQFGDAREDWEYERAIIAAYQAKLLAGVEMPEPYGKVAHEERPYEPAWISSEDAYDQYQLQQYAAAAAAQARVKALDEAKGVCLSLFDLEDDSCNEAEQCAAAIDKLKRGE